MLKKSKSKMKRRNTEPNINAPIAPNNSSESSGNRAETDPVDPEGITFMEIFSFFEFTLKLFLLIKGESEPF